MQHGIPALSLVDRKGELIEAFDTAGEISLVVYSIEVIADSILMVLASYGFYRLAKYTALNNSNKLDHSDE